MNQYRRWMTCIDVSQQARLRVVFSPKERGIAIVSKPANEFLIQLLNELRSVRGRVIRPRSNVRARDGLQVRHHKRGRHSLPTHVRAEKPKLSVIQIKEVIKITTDRPRRQSVAGDCSPRHNWCPAWEQIFLYALRHS